MTFTKFIQQSKNEFTKILIEDKNFFNQFKEMANKKGCWIHQNLLYEFDIIKNNENRSLKIILKKYIQDVDYIYENETKTSKKRNAIYNNMVYYLSSDCFKKICSHSKNKNSRTILDYFLNMEKLVL